MELARESLKSLSKQQVTSDWSTFSTHLEEVLAGLKEDHFLIVMTKLGNQYVQFSAQGALGMRIETTSNQFRGRTEQLSGQQMETLTRTGWKAPVNKAKPDAPDAVTDGSPNYYLDYASPLNFSEVAELAIRTLVEVLQIGSPRELRYKAFRNGGPAYSLPRLGLARERKARATTWNKKSLMEKLRSAVCAHTGIPDLAYDEDGDIALRRGVVTFHIRLVNDPPHICLHSLLLRDVKESPQVYEMMNTMNEGETLMRYLFSREQIYCTAYLPALPFSKENLAWALDNFSAVLEGAAGRLQAELGGRFKWSETAPAVTLH
jgi:hypothetical protein